MLPQVPATVLLLDDEVGTHEALTRYLEPPRFRLLSAYTARQAHKLLDDEQVDVVLLDLNLGSSRGEDFLDELHPDIDRARLEVLIFSAHVDRDLVVKCIKRRAYDYLDKTHPTYAAIGTHVERALAHRRERRATLAMRAERDPEEVVAQLGRSRLAAVRAVAGRIQELALSPGPILIRAEAGCHADFVALHMHQQGAARDCAFVRLGGAGSATLHWSPEPGETIFADATARPLDRARWRDLERLFVRSGVRLIVACDPAAPLELASRARQAFDARSVSLPPLRDRRVDLEWLVADLLGPELTSLTSSAQRALAAYRWPRNLVELETVIQQLAADHPGAEIDDHDLPLPVLAAAAMDASADGENLAFERSVDHFRRDLIKRGLAHSQGNIRAAARYLGLGESTVRELIKRFGLDKHATKL